MWRYKRKRRRRKGKGKKTRKILSSSCSTDPPMARTQDWTQMLVENMSQQVVTASSMNSFPQIFLGFFSQIFMLPKRKNKLFDSILNQLFCLVFEYSIFLSFIAHQFCHRLIIKNTRFKKASPRHCSTHVRQSPIGDYSAVGKTSYYLWSVQGNGSILVTERKKKWQCITNQLCLTSRKKILVNLNKDHLFCIDVL